MKKLLFASAMALVLVSCKKDKNEDTSTPITTQSISGTYTLGSITMKMGTSPETDATSSMDACQRDDRMTLNVDGSAIYTDAGTKCSPAGDDTGTWALTSNNTKLSLDGYEMTIQSFVNGALKLSETETISGTTYTYTITYNKQ